MHDAKINYNDNAKILIPSYSPYNINNYKQLKMGELIKLSDAVELVPYKLSTFRRMASEGVIPCTKIGSRYFVDAEEIKKFVKSITIKKEGNYVRQSLNK